MKLRDYISRLDDADRSALALACHTTLPHLRNVMYGYRPCGAVLAVDIEKYTGGQVTRPELRPTDWRRIWPELAANCEQKQPSSLDGQAVGAIGSEVV